MAQLTFSPVPLNGYVSSNGNSIPLSAPVGNEYANWLTDMLTDFAKNKSTIFKCATYKQIDIQLLMDMSSYLMFFPAIALPQDNNPNFKSMVCVGAANNVYLMGGQTPVCLSTLVNSVNITNNTSVNNMTVVPKFADVPDSSNVWSALQTNNSFSSWVDLCCPNNNDLPFKNVSVSNDVINDVFDLTNTDTLALIPVSLQFNNDQNNRNTLLLGGVNSNGQFVLPVQNEIWICADAVNKFGSSGIPPWRGNDFNCEWS